MPIQFFTPNKTVTGGLLAVNFTSRVGTFDAPGERSFWFNLVKQTGWDTETNKGSFKDGAKIGVKLTLDEIGGLIQAIRNQRECKFFHTFGESKTTGTFRYFFIEKDANGNPLKDKLGNPAPREGFGLTVKKDTVEIKVSFNLAAAENLSEYLKFGLNHCYQSIYSEDKKNAEEWNAKKDAAKNPTAGATKPGTSKKAPTKPAPAPEPEPETPTGEEDTGEVEF